MKSFFTANQKQIRLRLLTLLYHAHLSHIGSCMSVIDILDAIYAVKKKNEKFILSNGHTAAALYVILEKYHYLKNPDIKKLGVHPKRNPLLGIDVSTGSLGQGLPIAVGIALADRKKNVYCLISDGECAEGSIWESLRVVYDFNIKNLKIVLSANGRGAYESINLRVLKKRLTGFGFDIHLLDGHDTNTIKKHLGMTIKKPVIFFAKTSSEQLPFLKGLDAHYHVMTDTEYTMAQKILQ
jgi:transketolase